MQPVVSWFFEQALFRIYRYECGGPVLAALRELRASEPLSRDQLMAIQTSKLRSLLKHCDEHVPFYRQVMRSRGFSPEHFKEVTDIRALPLLDKETARDRFSDFVADNVEKKRVWEFYTGGSTGMPLRYVRDVPSRAWAEAAWIRGRSWAGVRLGMKTVGWSNSGSPSILGKIRSALIRHCEYPAFQDRLVALKWLNLLPGERARAIQSFPCILMDLAKIIDEEGLSLRVPVVFTTGETLYPEHRRFIEKNFHGEVFDSYGCNEVLSIAYECDRHVKHCTDEHVVVEVVNENGEPITQGCGEVVVTDLDSYAMPFVRYRTGDMAELTQQPCACGRKQTALAGLRGRKQEYLVSPDGGTVSGLRIVCAFNALTSIRQYRITQETPESVVVDIVRDETHGDAEVEYMRQYLADALGAGVDIKIKTVETIPRTSRGKNPVIVSKVRARLQASERSESDQARPA